MSTRKSASAAETATPASGPSSPHRADAPLRRRASIFLLLFPLLVLLYPLLQTYRIHDTAREHQRYAAYVEAVQRGDASSLRVPYGFARHPTPEARATAIAERLAEMDAHASSTGTRRVLAWTSLATAGTALIFGIVVLLGVERTRRQALASQEFLVARFATAWQRTSRLLLLQVALMMATLLLNVAFEVLWSYEHWNSHGFIAVLMTLPLWGGIAAMAGVLAKTRRAVAAPKPIVLDATARALPRARAPRLWQWLDAIAARVQAPVPDHIVIGLSDGFYVTSADVRLLPGGDMLQGRTLHVPLALASVLSERETAFIVGHELGHFAHADTDRSRDLAVMHRAMQVRIELLAARLEENDAWMAQAPLWTSLYALSSFDHAYAHWSRQQEFAADGIGAAATDARTGALALLRSAALQPALDAATDTPGGNVVTRLQASLTTTPPSLHGDRVDAALPHPIDSHPPTRHRIDALGVRIDEPLLAIALRAPDAHDQQWFADLLAATPAST